MPVPFTSGVTFTIDLEPPLVDVLSERHLQPLVQLMPQGVAWNYRPGSRLLDLLRGVARTFGRVDVGYRSLPRQLDPHTVTWAIADWERLLEISGGDLTLAERRLKVLAALRARGGQSGPYFREQLETLGYTNVVITRLGNPFRCGDRIRKRLQGAGWMYTFLISADSIPTLDEEMMAAIRDGLRASVIVHFNLT